MTVSLNDFYTPKQQEVWKQYLTTEFFMMFNCGSVRSGKTEINNDIFLMELKQVKKRATLKGVSLPQYICAGSSIATFYRNVIMQINNKYELDIKLDKYNSFELSGVKCTVFGHEKINDLNKITGMEAWGAYINEMTKANEHVFDEISKRCSGDGAKIIGDTNPDTPEHYIKKDYIDKADGKTILYNLFLLDENTFVKQAYKDYMKKVTPSGVFYRRKILGEWCSSDGVIYEDFDDKIHFITVEEYEKIEFKSFWAGVDWGYSKGHEGSIVVVGESIDGNYYVVEEISKTKHYIDYWIEEAKRINKKYRKKLLIQKIKSIEKEKCIKLNKIEILEVAKGIDEVVFYCDDARMEHVDAFEDAGLFVQTATKSVLSGIEFVAMLFKTNKLFIVKGEKNLTLIHKEIYLYIWGKDGKPKKSNDNALDGLRYCLYSHLKEMVEMTIHNLDDYL